MQKVCKGRAEGEKSFVTMNKPNASLSIVLCNDTKMFCLTKSFISQNHLEILLGFIRLRGNPPGSSAKGVGFPCLRLWLGHSERIQCLIERFFGKNVLFQAQFANRFARCKGFLGELSCFLVADVRIETSHHG